MSPLLLLLLGCAPAPSPEGQASAPARGDGLGSDTQEAVEPDTGDSAAPEDTSPANDCGSGGADSGGGGPSGDRSSGWSVDLTLPAASSGDYPAWDGQRPNFLLDWSWSSVDMPVPTLGLGRSLRIEVLIPPGVAYASVSAESNGWQGGDGSDPADMPQVGGFDHDPGPLCLTPSARPSGEAVCSSAADQGMGFVYLSDLHVVTAALSEPLYGDATPSYATTASARLASLVVYNPASSAPLTLGSLRISMLVMDPPAYDAWRASQGW